MILRVDPKGFYLYWTYQNKVSVKIAQVSHQTVSSGLCRIKTQKGIVLICLLRSLLKDSPNHCSDAVRIKIARNVQLNVCIIS